VTIPSYIPDQFFPPCEYSVGGVDRNGASVGTDFGSDYAEAKRFYRQQRQAGGKVSFWVYYANTRKARRLK
jgi:hypothetical protein